MPNCYPDLGDVKRNNVVKLAVSDCANHFSAGDRQCTLLALCTRKSFRILLDSPCKLMWTDSEPYSINQFAVFAWPRPV